MWLLPTSAANVAVQVFAPQALNPGLFAVHAFFLQHTLRSACLCLWQRLQEHGYELPKRSARGA
jgi:hypothetical protein